MENKSNFNKELFTTIALQEFLINYRRSKQEALRKQAELKKLNNSTKVDDTKQIKITVEDAYQHLLRANKNPEKKQILENCKNLFESDSTQKEVDLEIETIRNDTIATKGKNPTDSEVAKSLIKALVDNDIAIEAIFNAKKQGKSQTEIFYIALNFVASEVFKRETYDMSQLPAKGLLAPIKISQGKTSEVVSYVSFEQIQQEREKKDGKIIERPTKLFKDKHGNTLLIEFNGHLTYGSPNGNKSIRKYSITKNINGIEQKYKVFTKIDMQRLRSDEAYRNVVIHELLSPKNLNRSNADGYIGEILTESILNPRDEKLEGSIYTYQITSEHALVYDGEKLEAVRTHRKQELAKEAAKQSQTPTLDDEPEI